jgi:hypothetical protein
MTLHDHSGAIPTAWLAFELSVMRRLKFRSVAIPFVGEPDLPVYLKRWGARVAANDPARWAFTKATAMIENNTDRLDEAEVETVLEDAYVPRHRLDNPALLKWFNETDAWWFDNVRENAEKLDRLGARALALTIAMMVGDYVRSFDDETRELRQPLSQVFRRIWQTFPSPVNNSQRNTSTNRDPREFVAAQHTDLLFLRLPRNRDERAAQHHTLTVWREEWLNVGDGFWDEHRRARAGRLGAGGVATKQQYLRLVEDFLQTAAHLPAWAIAFVEDGFISTSELVESIGHVRKVETIYTKDFSELTGARATIITT